MKLKHVVVNTISSVLIASMMLPAVQVEAAVYSDITKHWARASIEQMSNYGVISGFNGKFRPNDNITRGEMAVVLANLMQYQTKGKEKFTDLDKNFYTDAIQKLNGAGVMNGSNGLVRPKDKVTRQEAMVMLANAFGIDDRSSVSYGFNDSGKIANWARGAVGALKASGFVSGDDKGNANPTVPITRGELVAIVDRMVGAYATKPGAISTNTVGNAVVTAENVEFISSRIGGNVVITEGNKGITILDDTAVIGKVITTKAMKELKVRGNSVVGVVDTRGDTSLEVDITSTANVQKVLMNDLKTLNLSGTVGSIEVTKASGSSVNIENSESKMLNVTVPNTKINIKGYSDLKEIQLSREADDCTVSVAKEASVGTISVDGEDAKLTINGDVSKIKIKENAEGAQLNISTGDNRIDEITIDAEDAKVAGSGTVRKIYVNASGANISVKDAVVYVDKKAENVIVSGEKVKGGTTINSSYTDDDTDWDDVSIDDIDVDDVNKITVELDNDGDDIEVQLKKNNFEVISNDADEDDPEISSVSAKSDSKKGKNTVYQITFKDDLEEKTSYKVRIELPDGSIISKSFKTPSDFDDLKEKEEEKEKEEDKDEKEEEKEETVKKEYPELKSIQLSRTSGTDFEVSLNASEAGSIWVYAIESILTGDPTITEVKENGKKISLRKGDNTLKIDGIETGKAYKVYMVSQSNKTSFVYGEYNLVENLLVTSTSIKDFRFKQDNGTYFELELTEKVQGGITKSNTTILGPGTLGNIKISDIVAETDTKYKLVTTTELKDGTYMLNIKFPDGTERVDSVVIDVPEPVNEEAPKLSNIKVERIREGAIGIEFKADHDGKCYILEGNLNADTLIATGEPKNIGENNLFVYELGSQDATKISIITTNLEGSKRSSVYTEDIPAFVDDTPEEETESTSESGEETQESQGEQGETQQGETQA